MFYYPTNLMKYLAAFLEWSCYRRCGFVAKQKISPNLLNFGIKMFHSFLLRKRVPTLYVSDHKQRSYWSSNHESKGAKIRNSYNQVPHLTQETNGKVTNSQLDTTNESQELSPFPAGDHKAHINRRVQRQDKQKTEKT